jgi:hypothetical protein
MEDENDPHENLRRLNDFVVLQSFVIIGMDNNFILLRLLILLLFISSFVNSISLKPHQLKLFLLYIFSCCIYVYLYHK